MITMLVRDGKAIKPDDCVHIRAYDPPVGTIIKFITEDGNEYHVITCNDSNACYDCAFNRHTGHQLSKIFKGSCGPEVTQILCYGRIYKPLDTVLEDL